MVWRVEFDERAAREFDRLDAPVKKRIASFPSNRIAGSEDPREIGKALAGEFAGCWRYRVGDYRIIAKLEAGVCLVLVIRVGHRREVYRWRRR